MNKVTFLHTITNSCFMSWLPCGALSSCTSFWHDQNVFGITDRMPEALSFLYRPQKKCLWIAITFVNWSECLMMHCSILKKNKKKCMSSRKSVVCLVLPQSNFKSCWLVIFLLIFLMLSVLHTDHRRNTKLWFSFLSLFKCYLLYFLFCSIYLHQDNVLNFTGHT